MELERELPWTEQGEMLAHKLRCLRGSWGSHPERELAQLAKALAHGLWNLLGLWASAVDNETVARGRRPQHGTLRRNHLGNGGMRR